MKFKKDDKIRGQKSFSKYIGLVMAVESKGDVTFYNILWITPSGGMGQFETDLVDEFYELFVRQ